MRFGKIQVKQGSQLASLTQYQCRPSKQVLPTMNVSLLSASLYQYCRGQ